MSTVPIGITIDKELLERIDKERGLVPRSRYIANALERSFEQKGSPKA